MRRACSLILGIVLFTTCRGAQATKTVGTSDPNYDYPTIAAAFAAINAGGIVDGIGDPADSVVILLMDPVFNEPELVIAAPPSVHSVLIRNNPAGDGSDIVVNIGIFSATGVGIRIDNLEAISMSGMQFNLDTSSPWETGIRVTCPESVLAVIGISAVTLNNVETGIEVAGVPAVLHIENNTVTNSGCGVRVAPGGPIHQNQGHTNLIAIRHNTISGSSDGSFVAIEGISLDSLAADTVDVGANTVTGFVIGIKSRSVTNHQSAHEEPPFDQLMARFSDNSITGLGVDSGIGISIDGFSAMTLLDHNTVDMGSEGTALKPRCLFIHGVGDAGPQMIISSNHLTNTNAGAEVILDVDTTGAGLAGSPVRAGSVEISDNVVVDGGNRPAFGLFKDHPNNGHGQGNINSISIKRNILKGNDVPLSVGIFLDTLPVAHTEIDSNDVKSFALAVEICPIEQQLTDMFDKETFCGFILRDNTIGTSGNGMDIGIEHWAAGESTKVLIEGNNFIDNSGFGLRVTVGGDSGFIDAIITGNVFSGNGGDGGIIQGRNKSEYGNGAKFGFDKGHGHNNSIEPGAQPAGGRDRVPFSNYPPNSFLNNGGSGLVLDSLVDVPGGIHFQNFGNNGAFNFVNRTTNAIDAAGNWWGSIDSAYIAAHIFDGNDSAGLGVCDFYPYLGDSIGSSVTQTAITLLAGWNLVSVPVRVSDHGKTALFPAAVSPAFAYSGSYQSHQELANGEGYWIKCGAPQQQELTGATITAESIAVHAGWNIVGSISSNVAVGSITSVPPGIMTSQFYRYSGSYSVADSIAPGSGYWVKANTAGVLILSDASGPIIPSYAIHIVATDDGPPPAPGSENAMPVPEVFALRQNFPNPFNPTTTIQLELPVMSKVSLTVYDVLGRQVSSLLAGELIEAGARVFEFDGSNLASGMYYYTVRATPALPGSSPQGGFTQSKKMIVVK